MRLEIYILLYAFFQSCKMTSHVKLILLMRISTVSRIAIYHSFIIYYLFIHSFILYFIPERLLLGRICLWIVSIWYAFPWCIYLLPSVLNCIYETSALFLPFFRNKGNIFRQMDSPEHCIKNCLKYESISLHHL